MVSASREIQPSEGGLATSRLKTQIRVYYGPTQKTILSDFSADLSTGGLYLTTDIPFKLDQRLTLYFSLPGQGSAVRCKARVAWVNQGDSFCKAELPQGVGVEFSDLSSENLESISGYLKLEANW